ncbi:MAG: adenylate/guanylate cyclase domain-containing protein [Chloroflexi bacterium]|nr:adenylate/guanylate cyclase domain-containing protein [Chloroflexota bacterium]
MEPQIQYAKTSDGVSIAYYAIGQGPAVLYLAMPHSHLEAEWDFEPMRMGFTAAAQRATFVRLDPRGFGLSDREPDDFEVDGFVLDIEAVVDRLGLEKLRIFSVAFATVPALVYTARHPDKVTHLVLAPPATSANDLSNERLEKVAELAKVDYELATETAARTLFPEFPDQLARDFARLMRAGIDQTGFQRLLGASRLWDADSDAASISTPTLLLHPRNNPNFDVARTRRVAGLIKDSRVAFTDNAFEGPLLAQRFFEGDTPDLTEPASMQAATPPEAGAMRTILFTDVEGSTALTQRLGDAKAREVLREHERMVREALRSHGGAEVKTMGDGFMASFTSATGALECAIAMQRAFAQHNESAEEPIKVRVGLNAGEPIAEDDPDGRSDLFGTAVNLAARIAAQAEGGEVLASDVVRQLVAGKRFLFADRGETALRGFEDPVRLYEVRWREGE